MFFFFLRLACTCEETCKSVWPPNASRYASLTCVHLRLLAGRVDQGFRFENLRGFFTNWSVFLQFHVTELNKWQRYFLLVWNLRKSSRMADWNFFQKHVTVCCDLRRQIGILNFPCMCFIFDNLDTLSDRRPWTTVWGRVCMNNRFRQLSCTIIFKTVTREGHNELSQLALANVLSKLTKTNRQMLT